MHFIVIAFSIAQKVPGPNTLNVYDNNNLDLLMKCDFNYRNDEYIIPQ